MANSKSTSRRAFLIALLPMAALAVALGGLVVASAPSPAGGAAQAKAAPAGGGFRAADLVALTKRFARFSDDLPAAAQLGVKKVLAYEENRSFTYLRGAGPGREVRVIFCKPATFVIDDRPASGAGPWRLVCGEAPKVAGDAFSVSEGDAVITGRVLLPGGTAFKAGRSDGAGPSGKHVVDAVGSRLAAGARRGLYVLHVAGKGAAAPKAQCKEADGAATLRLAVGGQTFSLTLPAEANEPGAIAVAGADGKAVLPRRPLPAGVMPHGPGGVKMLERWDRPYRGRRMPGWDTGRPATELVKAVEAGAIRPGRALVLGCGTGTNAIYLAKKGFDVTGVDIAPTALVLARQRARKAKLRIRWLVADALAVPNVGPFDFIFDRGCYHHLRLVDPKGYAHTVHTASKPGSLLLLLAANANESRHYGPPRAAETHLVRDFAPSWAFVWLKEIRFDSRDPNATGGLWAWSLLARRRTPKK